jgi:hypothetical protein
MDDFELIVVKKEVFYCFCDFFRLAISFATSWSKGFLLWLKSVTIF